MDRAVELTSFEHAGQRSGQLTPAGQPPPMVQAALRYVQVVPMAPVVHAVPPEPAPAPVVQREPIVGSDVAPAPSAEPAPDVIPEAGAEPTGVPGPASAAAAAGAPAAGSPEEMAKKLFDPLLRRLKTELRLDRERRGTLTDLRH